MRAGLDNWIDIVILVVYFILVLAVGLLSVCRKGRDSVKGYFLAGRSMLWFPIGASLFASNIGSEHFIGLAGSGAASGIAVVAFEWGAALCLPLLGWVFLPIYLSSGIFTIPEYLSKRFGGTRLRTYLSILALFLYIVTKISVDVYAGSVFIQQALGWNTYLAIIILLSVTAVYTVVGGLAAVIFTDTLQTIIMLVGAVTLAILGFTKVGGINGLIPRYMEAIPDSLRYAANITTNDSMSNVTSLCGHPRKDAFHIIRDAEHSDLPWPGLIIRSTFVSTWYWCADQVIVQRALAAKDIGHARGATLMAGYLKFLPLFIIIMPGMISRVLFTEDVACADAETCMKVCENPVGCSNVAYPKLILGLAPTGLRGLMMAVMMSALMSSLTSIFNSAATLFTMDLWTKIRKQATERELLVVGKVFVVILVGVSVAWIPLIQNSQQGQLFLYIQAVTGYLAPPICSVFLLAVFVPQINEKGAFWGMLIGQVAGIVRMLLDFVYPKPKCGEPDTRPGVISQVHFTYFSAGLLVFTGALVILFSLLNRKNDNNQGKHLTFWSSPSVKYRSGPHTDKFEMQWRRKFLSEQSRKHQVNVRNSVRERWSLTDSTSKSNQGFEMQEVQTTDAYVQEYISTDSRKVDGYEDLKHEKEDHYTELKSDLSIDKSQKTIDPVGYEVNDNVTENSSVESTDNKYREPVKVKFSPAKLNEDDNDDNTRENEADGNDVSDKPPVKLRKPVAKSNSKVWKREVEKQPGWQNFVLEFTKKLSEVDGDSEKVVEHRMGGKDLLRRHISPPDVNPYEERKQIPDVSNEKQKQINETNEPSKELEEQSKLVPASTETFQQTDKTEEIPTASLRTMEAGTMNVVNGQSQIEGSRYSGRLSLDIFKAQTPPQQDFIEYDSTVDSARHKLYIGKFAKWFLDINAIVLICVFVFLYFIFH